MFNQKFISMTSSWEWDSKLCHGVKSIWAKLQVIEVHNHKVFCYSSGAMDPPIWVIPWRGSWQCSEQQITAPRLGFFKLRMRARPWTTQGVLRWYFSCNKVRLLKGSLFTSLSSGIKYACTMQPPGMWALYRVPHGQVGVVARVIICGLLVIIIVRSECRISWLKIITLNCCWADDVTCPRSHHDESSGWGPIKLSYL